MCFDCIIKEVYCSKTVYNLDLIKTYTQKMCTIQRFIYYIQQ